MCGGGSKETVSVVARNYRAQRTEISQESARRRVNKAAWDGPAKVGPYIRYSQQHRVHVRSLATF